MKNFSLSTKIASSLVAIVTSLIIVCSVFIYNSQYKNIQDMLGSRLDHIARSGSIQLSSLDHQYIINAYQRKDPNLNKSKEFIRQQKVLKELKRVNDLKQDIYTFYVPSWAPKKMIFLAMSNDTTYSGHAIDTTEIANRAFRTGKPAYSDIYSTELGEWVSAISPIKNQQGEVIAALSIDYRADQEVAAIKKVLMKIIIFPSIMALVLSVVIGMIIGKSFSTPLDELVNSTKKIAEGNMGEVKLQCYSSDEIGELTKSFSEMCLRLSEKDKQIKEHTSNLESIVAERTKSLEKANSELEQQYQELESAQKQLVRNEKLASIGKLAASVGHEVNNPLMVIRGFSDLIKRQVKKEKQVDEEFLNEKLERINIAVTRITHMIKNLKKFSRQDESENIVISVHDTIHEAKELLENMYSSEGIDIRLKLTGDDKIFANPSEFIQVIVNLISNAKDAVLRSVNKTITVSTSNDENFLKVKVTDCGMGMDQSTIEKIFDPFFTTKAAVEGTGIGLGVCHEIVKKFDGDITVDSEVGRGTTFTLSFPLVADIIEIDSFQSEDNSEVDIDEKIEFDGRILILEDDTNVRTTLSLFFEDVGINFDVFIGGREALKSVGSNNYDFIFTDYTMPTMNGVEFATNVRDLLGVEATIILITGNVDYENYLIKYNHNGKEVDLFDYSLNKPFSYDELFSLFKKLVEDKQAA